MLLTSFVMPTNWFLILKRLKITDGMKKVKSVGAMNAIQRWYQIFFLRKNTVVRIHLVIMATANHILKMISTMMQRTSRTFYHCHYLDEKDMTTADSSV